VKSLMRKLQVTEGNVTVIHWNFDDSSSKVTSQRSYVRDFHSLKTRVILGMSAVLLLSKE
jgi:hypothetical protein